MKIEKMLHLDMEPVGIYFGNTTIVCDMTAPKNQRNCVMPYLAAAGRGKIVSLDEESCTCAGGAVGCCFGDGFARRNPNIHKMLAQGLGDEAPASAPEKVKEGERFFCDDTTAMRWRNSLPFSEKGYPRIVFAPKSRWESTGLPDLVYVFADPNQLSALVTMLGFHNGSKVNTIAPFGAACHSIVYAAEQMDSDTPKAVLGLFDISQRKGIFAKYLSLTMPYTMWEDICADLEKSCLTTHSWKQIEKNCYTAHNDK